MLRFNEEKPYLEYAIFDKLVIEAKEHDAKVGAIQNEITHFISVSEAR
jgi:hypothetical protein